MPEETLTLPDGWEWVAFDDFGGRIKAHRDHIGIAHCGPDAVTLCGSSLKRHGYNLGRPTRIDEPFVCNGVSTLRTRFCYNAGTATKWGGTATTARPRHQEVDS